MKISSLQRHVLNKIRCYLGRVVDSEEEEEDVVAAVEAAAAVQAAVAAVEPAAPQGDLPQAAAPQADLPQAAATQPAPQLAAEDAPQPKRRCVTCYAEARNSKAAKKLSTVNSS